RFTTDTIYKADNTVVRLGEEDAALDLIADELKPVVVFVHGFNESPARALGIGQALVDALPDLTLVQYLWPSEGEVYDYEQDRIKVAASAGDILNCLRALDCPNVIAHSMGNFGVQEALKLVNGSTAPYIDKLVMIAPDVPFDALETSNISQLTNKGLVMYS